MAIDIVNILDQVESLAAQIGVFDRINKHEPKSAPGTGYSLAIFVQAIDPIRGSGLNSTSIRLEFREHIYTSMLSEPQDGIDTDSIRLTDLLLEQYSAHFTLGGEARHIDVMGAYGTSLSARAGYIDIDNKKYRVMEITLPIIVDDVWDYAP